MLQKFFLFFIAFGLSFLVQHFGWADQGTAFIWIYVSANVLLIISMILICIFAGNGLGEKLGYSFIVAIIYAIMLGITFLATWGASALFSVDFAVTFQIMCFGQCLCGNTSKKE